MTKPTTFPNRSDTDRAVQAQEMSRGCKEELYCPCNENKGADQLRSRAASTSRHEISTMIFVLHSVHSGEKGFVTGLIFGENELNIISPE